MQRDREFAHYQDDAAFYHKRPSLWVEPLGNWGRGTLQLIHLPTADEYARAQRVIEALSANRGEAIQLDGKLVDRPIEIAAERAVALGALGVRAD